MSKHPNTDKLPESIRIILAIAHSEACAANIEALINAGVGEAEAFRELAAVLEEAAEEFKRVGLEETVMQ